PLRDLERLLKRRQRLLLPPCPRERQRQLAQRRNLDRPPRQPRLGHRRQGLMRGSQGRPLRPPIPPVHRRLDQGLGAQRRVLWTSKKRDRRLVVLLRTLPLLRGTENSRQAQVQPR